MQLLHHAHSSKSFPHSTSHSYWTCLVSNASRVNAMPELLVEKLSKRTEEGVPEEEVLTEELELLLPRLKEDDTEVSSRSSTSCSYAGTNKS